MLIFFLLFAIFYAGESCTFPSLTTPLGCADGVIILRPLIGEIIHSTTVDVSLAVHAALRDSTIALFIDSLPTAKWRAENTLGAQIELPPGRHTIKAISTRSNEPFSEVANDNSDGEILFSTEEIIFWTKEAKGSSSSSQTPPSSAHSSHSSRSTQNNSPTNSKTISPTTISPTTISHRNLSAVSVVFGVEHNLRKGEIQSFAGSFRATGSRAEIILWTSGRRPELEQVAEIFEIQLIDYDFWLLNRTYGPVGDHRFHLFREFLEQPGNMERFSNILVTDVRDVMFQLDPFTHIEFGRGVATFQEAEYMPIHASWTNRHWLTDNCTTYKNENMLERIQHNKRSCSGVTIGTAEGMYAYIKTMEEELQRTKDAVFDENGNVVARGWCADQAVHQTVFYTGMLEKQGVEVVLHSNEYGPLLTIGDVLFYNVTDNGDVINWAGEIVAMVHQFDRHQPLREAMQNMYWDEDERDEYQRRYPKYRGHGEATEEDEKKWEEEERKRGKRSDDRDPKR